ncbi:DUF2855 family protein [Shewanella youngdeokensis]|uniref:DUF2855 family protein n=1 Tax=Shewanella youngdeokensis TaxID=2999068 RepID=A0ABZ0K359_9GAMM|nr:DUF2855 family protein [Shewanella sp. DAU334]
MTASNSTTNHPFAFEVGKNALHKTRIVPLDIAQPLLENEVLLKVDKFALTANNISYGITGAALGYWQFFPCDLAADRALWGRLPVMGFADVIESNCCDIQVGERVWGFMPMASHVKIQAGKVSKTGFTDISPCRDGLAPLYSRFDRVTQNLSYSVKNEDYDILLRGLFTTSWLVDDFMFDHEYFGAQQYLITSASSKTSIALAFSIKQRGERPAIAITSEANLSFVSSLGCYDHVVSYADIHTLDSSVASILVDMAGGQSTLSAVHQHFADNLRYSCRIGVTQHTDVNLNNSFSIDNLPGAKPEFFFAPTQLQKRSAQWGAAVTMAQVSRSMLAYIDFCRASISIDLTTNLNDLNAVYQRILAGTADASVGHIICVTAN